MSEARLLYAMRYPLESDGADITILLTDEERRKFYALPREPYGPWATVTTADTGEEWEVRPAPCGAGCFCAAEARPAGAKSLQDRVRHLADLFSVAQPPPSLTCAEAEAIAECFVAAGYEQAAKRWLDLHATTDDDPADLHHRPEDWT